MMSIGIIGTGAIAEAVVTGLCNKTNPPQNILLSPRNEKRAQRLAERFSIVEISRDNQSVITGCDLVLLAVRPQVLDEALEGLSFRKDQRVLSLIAGISIHKLERLVAPASHIVRMIPLPSIARNEGPILMTPPSNEIAELFQDLGALIQLDHEDQIETFCAVTGLMAPYFGLLDHCTRWLRSKGITHSQAFDFVGALFECLGRTPRDAPEKNFGKVAADHATPQGYNEQAFREFKNLGWYQDVSDVLNLLNRRLAGKANFEDGVK